MECVVEDMMGWASKGLLRYSETRLVMADIVCVVKVNSRLSCESTKTHVASSLRLMSSSQLPAPSTPSIKRFKKSLLYH